MSGDGGGEEGTRGGEVIEGGSMRQEVEEERGGEWRRIDVGLEAASECCNRGVSVITLSRTRSWSTHGAHPGHAWATHPLAHHSIYP